MEKQKRNLIILVVVVVICIALYFILTKVNQRAQEKEEENNIYALQVNSNDITEFSYTYGETTYTFSLKNKEWSCEQLSGQELSEDSINSLLNTLSAIEVQQVIEDATDLSQYGLEDTTNTFTIATKEESNTFLLGDYNDTTGNYYIKNEQSDDVYVVESSVITAIETDPSGLVETQEDTSSSN